MDLKHPVSILVDLFAAVVGVLLFLATVEMNKTDSFSWTAGVLLLVAIGLGYHIRRSGWFREPLDYRMARIIGFTAVVILAVGVAKAIERQITPNDLGMTGLLMMSAWFCSCSLVLAPAALGSILAGWLRQQNAV